MPTLKCGTYTVDCHDIVNTLEFCPYEWSCHLLVFGTSDRVVVGSIRFQEENPEITGVEFIKKREFHHGSRVTVISWSPDTSLLTVPKLIRFSTGGSDHKVRVFSSDLSGDDKVDEICQHRDYVNDVCFHPENGDMVASVSDDHTCRVTNCDGSQMACFPLGSPGMAVAWPKEEAGKVMVAEKKGVIRFYNIQSQQPIMSFDCGHVPLVYSHVSPKNPLAVAAVTGTDLTLFDTSRSSRPIEIVQTHTDGCHKLQWSRSHEHLLATYGRPGPQIKVFNMRTGQVTLQAELSIANGLSWHYRLPIVAVGGDKKIHFWVIDTV